MEARGCPNPASERQPRYRLWSPSCIIDTSSDQEPSSGWLSLGWDAIATFVTLQRRCESLSSTAVSDCRDIFETAGGLLRDGTPFVLITVTKTKGSTPRDAGAKMIWCPALADRRRAGCGSEGSCGAGGRDRVEGVVDRDTRAVIGTVGGGQFEHLVIDAAEKHMRDRSCGTEQYVLGADADQCCGGVMDVFFEYHGAARRLVIFGAGHVAFELAAMLGPGSGAPMSVAIVDDRTAWNSADRFPHARRMLAWDEGVRFARERAEETLVCVMTCSHDTDFDLLRAVLRPACEGADMPGFVGLIGSRSKRACLFGRLVASGIDEARVQKVQCPIGVGDTGKAPRLVAISMAAQLLLECGKRVSV